ncbi:TonB C-terminal domain-containing protein [Desulfurobacterium thermolithotrophum]|uniref:TonB C-terminal domain-containing protein n=1 Tax=Desulfurobacterium thermolithotrophum TaxID=64160 RepID=UPI0013D0AA71|nr:TonB C-terminal domain-containing protein [Desulfurobacterium thermolithotrophum]
MFKEYKLDLFSLMISLTLHVLLLFLFGFTEIFKVKTYQIVDILTLSFDSKVDSKLIGEKANKGNLEDTSLQKGLTEIPQGENSKKRRVLKEKTIAQYTGKFKSINSNGIDKFKGADKTKGYQTGKGKIALSLSMDDIRKEKNRKLPAITSSKLVPYFLRIKEKIISNWKNPYSQPLNSLNKDRKVVISLSIDKNGKLNEINIEKLSSDMLFNRSVISAIYSSEPFDPIPKIAGLDKVRLRVEFEIK